MPSQGFARDAYAGVRTVFDASLARGQEVGASVCITVDGEPVVDLWGGSADAAHTRAWERDTIVNVYSVTKTVVALTAMLVADRGELDFAAPVARYWPEFAANGKEQVTVAQVMSHSSGLSGWREPITAEDLYDWEKVTALLAAQAPFWRPGTASGYHALTQGYLVGEVVRRISGRTLGTLFRQEIAEPLGVDFHIGLPDSEDRRVAELVPPQPPDAPFGGDAPTELQSNTSDNPRLDVSITATRAWRGAEIPAVNGTGNARSVAAALAVLATGGVACSGPAKGRQLLSEAGCRKPLEVQIEGRDLVLGTPVQFGLGFGVGGGMPSPDTLYWAGWGGSFAVVDLDTRTSFAYAMNRMSSSTTGDVRALELAMAMWEG